MLKWKEKMKNSEHVTLKIPLEIKQDLNKLLQEARKKYSENGMLPSVRELAIASNIEECRVLDIMKQVLQFYDNGKI